MRYHARLRKGKIRLLLLLLLSMAVGGAATYGFLGRQQHAGSRKPKAEPEKKDNEQTVQPTYVDMGPFLVNLSSPDRLRYLRAEVTLGVVETDPKKHKKGDEGEGKSEAAKLPPADDAKARDVIVQVLSRQSFARLRTQGPDGELRKALQEELARQLTQTKVVSVLFTSFVMQ